MRTRYIHPYIFCLGLIVTSCFTRPVVDDPTTSVPPEADVLVDYEPAGPNCATGGQRITVVDGRGATTTSYVCDGSLISVEMVPAGAECPAGGQKIVVSSQEGRTTNYICNGDGASSGSSGTAVIVTTEPPGGHCDHGGIKIAASGEVRYVCDGASGKDGQSVVSASEPPGPNCDFGGVKLTSASGTDFVCNGDRGRLLSVNAGADQSVLVGATVTLAGSAAKEVMGVRWTQILGPQVTLSQPQSPTPTFVAPDYQNPLMRHLLFELEGSDGDRIESDLVVIRLNHAPTAPTVEITPTSPSELDDLICTMAGASQDTDGDAISYSFSWTKNGAPFNRSVSVGTTASMVPHAQSSNGDVFACTVRASDAYAAHASTTVTQTVGTCYLNPCLNGGVCANTKNGHLCLCAQGYSGPSCETNINDCSPNPCKNGGTCKDGVNRYTCRCKTGWTGERCETRDTSCSGGTCH